MTICLAGLSAIAYLNDVQATDPWPDPHTPRTIGMEANLRVPVGMTDAPRGPYSIGMGANLRVPVGMTDAPQRARTIGMEENPWLAVHDPESGRFDPPSVKEVRRLREDHLCLQASPVELLVRDPADRRRNPTCHCRTNSGFLPWGAILEHDGLLVCCPAFAILQVAGTFPLVTLCQLVSDVCGTYTIVRGDRSLGIPSTARSARPLGSREVIRSFLTEMEELAQPSCLGGIRKLHRAVDLSFDNCASPREVILALLLCLPSRLGGFGIPRPLCNREVAIPSEYRQLSKGARYIPDLLWEDAKLDVEYDSNQEHLDPKQAARDAIRRNDLTTAGYTVIGITNGQLKDPVEFARVAHQIIRALGIRDRKVDSDARWRERNRELRRLLFSGKVTSVA